MLKIDVRSAEDAITGFNFSRAHGVRLVIKNTGVSHPKFSSTDSQLSMRPVSISTTSWVAAARLALLHYG